MFGFPVWIGVDWGKCRDIPSGTLDPVMFKEHDAMLNLNTMSKGEMLESCASKMTHAVCIVGIDKDGKEETRYRIENSHGNKGIGGFYHASESYLRLFMYQAAIMSSLLPREISDLFAQTAIELKPWDPMGALAK